MITEPGDCSPGDSKETVMRQYQPRINIPKELIPLWEAYCKENLYPVNGQEGVIALMRTALIQWNKTQG